MRRRFTEEFKQEAVKLVLNQGLSKAQVAQDLGIGESTLAKWVSQHRGKNQPDELVETEREELKRLRKEVNTLRMEREVLKKATAFFAKHTG